MKSSVAIAAAWVRLVRDPLSLTEYAAAKTIHTPEEVAAFLQSRADTELNEVFWALCLNTKNRLLGAVEVSRGSLNASIVEPRDTFRTAVALGTFAIILAHNHPSGDTTPSSEDIAITKRLVKAGEILNITVLDHVILAPGARYSSLKELGLI